MQPWLERRPTPYGLLVPWIRKHGQPPGLTYAPTGLSAPRGTVHGGGAPASLCSLRTDAGGNHVGFVRLPVTLVVPSGVCQPTLPMPIGCGAAVCGSPSFTFGK